MDPTFGVSAPNPNVIEEDLNQLWQSVYENSNRVQKLEEQVAEVQKYYSTINDQVNNAKDKSQEKHVIGTKRSRQGGSSKEANSSNTMKEVMHQFSTIFHQASANTLQLFFITQHRWAWPFMDPVDVEGLGLSDYYQIIEKPMDFGTIKRKMDAKDGSGYKNVRQIYSDVTLVFKNAMKYNDEKTDIHIMAKTLLEKFEKKWLQLLPKVAQAESEKEEARALLKAKLAEEAAYANMTKDIRHALCDVDEQLKNLKEMVIKKCRKLSTHEKLALKKNLNRLNGDNLLKAMAIIHEIDPTFQHDAPQVDLDLDCQSDFILWKLNMFVKQALEDQDKAVAEDVAVNHNVNTQDQKNTNKRRKL
ncbi:Transcription factor GTE1 [Glycine soja]